MRRDNKLNPAQAKHLARSKYAERQIEKWWKWSFNQRGKIKYKDISKIAFNQLISMSLNSTL